MAKGGEGRPALWSLCLPQGLGPGHQSGPLRAVFTGTRSSVARGETQTARRPSAVELTTAFISQHNQPSDQQALNTLNTACGCKHPRRFVSIEKVNTF